MNAQIYGIHILQGKENGYMRFNMYISMSMVTDLVGVSPLLLYFGSGNPDKGGFLSAKSAGLTQVFIQNLQPR